MRGEVQSVYRRLDHSILTPSTPCWRAQMNAFLREVARSHARNPQQSARQASALSFASTCSSHLGSLGRGSYRTTVARTLLQHAAPSHHAKFGSDLCDTFFPLKRRVKGGCLITKGPAKHHYGEAPQNPFFFSPSSRYPRIHPHGRTVALILADHRLASLFSCW